MKRSLRLILALVLLLALSGLYLVLKNRPADVEETTAPERIELVAGEAEELQAIEVQRRDGGGLSLRKQGDTWTTEVPWPEELNTPKLNQLAASAALLTADRLITESEENLGDFGLAPPEAHLRLTFSDGSEELLEIGETTPSGSKRYLKKADSTEVYTVASFLLHDLFSSVEEFRVRTVPGINPQSLRYLSIRKPDETITIVSVDSLTNEPAGSILSRFAMTEPYGPRGIDSQALEELVGGFPQEFTIREFVDDAPQSVRPYGLDRPDYTLDMSDDTRRLKIELGKQREDGSFFARFNGEKRVVALSAEETGFTKADGFELTEKFILIVNIDTVDSFTVEANGREYEARIERHGDGEEIEEEYFFEGNPVDEKAFKALYQSLIGIVADAPNEGEADSGSPRLTVRYRLNSSLSSPPHSGTDKTLAASFVPVDRDFYAAYRGGESRFLVATRQIEAAMDSLAAFSSDAAPDA